MSNGSLHRDADWSRFANDIAKAFGNMLGMSVNAGNLYGTLQDHWERQDRLRRSPGTQSPRNFRQSYPFVVLICANCGHGFSQQAHEAYLNLYDAYVVIKEIISGRKHPNQTPSGSLGVCQNCDQPLDPHTLHYERLEWQGDRGQGYYR